MSYSKMEYEALQSHFNFSQTEEYVKKMIDTEGIDFVRQFLIPTTQKVWYYSDAFKGKLIRLCIEVVPRTRLSKLRASLSHFNGSPECAYIGPRHATRPLS